MGNTGQRDPSERNDPYNSLTYDPLPACRGSLSVNVVVLVLF